MIEHFIQERKYLKAVTTKTLAWYKDSFKAFEGALDSTETINTRIVELRKRGVKPVSINTWLRCVKAYYLWQGKEWKVGRLKEEQRIVETLSADGIRTLMNFRPNAGNERRALLAAVLICDTGLRISEALGLRKGDVNFEQCTVTVIGKGNKERVVPFSQEMRKRLFLHLRDHKEDYIFATRTGTQVSVRNFERDFNRVCKKAGIEGVRTSPHTLRHSFSVHYLRNGGNLEFLRRILGHSSILTTQKYLKSLGVADLSAVHAALSPLSAKR